MRNFLLLLLVAALGWWVFRAVFETDASQGIETGTGAARRVPVKCFEVGRRRVAETLRFDADLLPLRRETIFARKPVRVSEVLVKIGDTVSANDVLVRLDRKEPLLKFDVVRMKFEKAQKDHSDLKAQYVKGDLSEDNMKMAELALENATADWRALNDTVDIKSPIGGIVTEVNAEVGQTAGSAKPVAVVSDHSQIEVRFSASRYEKDLLKPGMKLLVGGAEGVIASVSPVADQTTQRFPIRGLVRNDDDGLVPGARVQITVVISTPGEVPVIPRYSVVEQKNSATAEIFVVEEKNGELIAVRRTVRLGRRDESFHEATGNVAVGELVVVAGQSQLSDGSKVKVVGTRESFE